MVRRAGARAGGAQRGRCGSSPSNAQVARVPFARSPEPNPDHGWDARDDNTEGYRNPPPGGRDEPSTNADGKAQNNHDGIGVVDGDALSHKIGVLVQQHAEATETQHTDQGPT